jgi:hypothetical protein
LVGQFLRQAGQKRGVTGSNPLGFRFTARMIFLAKPPAIPVMPLPWTGAYLIGFAADYREGKKRGRSEPLRCIAARR